MSLYKDIKDIFRGIHDYSHSCNVIRRSMSSEVYRLYKEYLLKEYFNYFDFDESWGVILPRFAFNCLSVQRQIDLRIEIVKTFLRKNKETVLKSYKQR